MYQTLPTGLLDGMTHAILTQRPTVAVGHLSLVPGAPRSPLSTREQRVLTLVADGCSTREVAQRMHFSERTIKNVLQVLCERTHSRNRTQAAVLAVRRGWI